MLSSVIKEIDKRIRANDYNRFLIGITGPPAAGKTTLSKELETELNKIDKLNSKVVPMDGFHLSNEELIEINLLPLKGIPNTFDAEGFVQLIRKLKESLNESIKFPLFDRSIESTIADADTVSPEHNIVILEGNYLLLETTPWHHIRNYLDFSIYLDVNEKTLWNRSIERHMAGGKTKDEAQKKVDSTDMPNTKLVSKTKNNANIILALD